LRKEYISVRKNATDKQYYSIYMKRGASLTDQESRREKMRAKGRIFVIGVVLAVMLGSSVEAGKVIRTCTDSDGGIDKDVKGVLTVVTNGKTQTYTDACIGTAKKPKLQEYYCSKSNTRAIEMISCPCKDGACVTSSDTCVNIIPGSVCIDASRWGNDHYDACVPYCVAQSKAYDRSASSECNSAYSGKDACCLCKGGGGTTTTTVPTSGNCPNIIPGSVCIDASRWGNDHYDACVPHCVAQSKAYDRSASSECNSAYSGKDACCLCKGGGGTTTTTVPTTGTCANALPGSTCIDASRWGNDHYDACVPHCVAQSKAYDKSVGLECKSTYPGKDACCRCK
jgi:endonuclease YncB( thermonuclease family)